MEYYFSAYQIADMAMKIEEAGASFYARFANSVKDQDVKNIFMILSKAELAHRKTFSEIAESFRKEEVNEYSVDLAMLMQNQIEKLKEAAFNFHKSERTIVGIPEALEIAIQTEKEAIRIFTEIDNSFIARFHEILATIISEEKKHLEILLDIKQR